MPFPSLEQESDLPKSLLADLAPYTSSPDNVTEDILVDLPTTLNNFCELEVGKQSALVSELEISITPKIELHDLDDLEIISQELCEELTAPTILDFDDDTLYAEYESFSYEFEVTEGLDLGSHAEFESFSFDSIIPDLLIKSDDNILEIEYESFCRFDVNMSLKEDFRAEYESFSVDPVRANLLLEYCNSSLSSLLSSLDPLESTFLESKTLVLDTPCLDQIRDDNDINRLKDPFELQDLNLGHHLSSNFQIFFDWPCFSPLPSPLRGDVGFHLDESDHLRWCMHSCSYIFLKPLTCASDFTYTHLSSDWAASFDKLKRTLSCIAIIHLIWALLHVSNYVHFCKDCARSFDKLLRALVGFDMSSCL